jgi:MFS family permease
MNAAYKAQLEKNIVKYSWYKIFTKRVFLPLITIQLVTVGKVTLEELAIIVIVSSIVQAVLQMPAGYVADKIGNRKSIILGAAIAVTSPLFYAFMPNFWGGMIASVLFFGGYAFQSGAIEAFIHNTLIALDKEKNYAKVMGRAQTYGLVGNIVLIALVPLTYPINNALPFIIGFFSLVGMLWLTISFKHPVMQTDPQKRKNPIQAIKSVVTLQNLALFIFSGFLAGVANKGGEFRELLFQDIGIAVALFGFILALGSLAGAAMGWFVHILDRLKPLSFYLFDLLVIVGCMLLIGATSNPIVAIIAFTIYAAYTRVRHIIFQAKMLHDITHAYKATLISALNMFTVLGDVIAITLLTKFVTDTGYLTGYVLFGVAIFTIGIILWLFMVWEAGRRKPVVV